MKLTVDEGGDLELIPENDQVNAMLTSVELNEFTYEGEDIKKMRWHFTVTDEGAWKGKDITGDTSLTFSAHPNCRAYSWAVAIAGRDYEVASEFDSDDLLGMRCRILIGHKTQKSSGRVFMKVNDVMSPRPVVAAGLSHDPAVDGQKF